MSNQFNHHNSNDFGFHQAEHKAAHMYAEEKMRGRVNFHARQEEASIAGMKIGAVLGVATATVAGVAALPAACIFGVGAGIIGGIIGHIASSDRK